MWVRVSNAVQDPVTSIALAQDQVVRVVNQEDDWYSIETLDGEKGRLPKVLANEISNPLRSSSEQVYCAIAPFEAERDGDLPFSLYSILVIESVETEGWLRGIVVSDTGKRLGKSGIVPTTYVKQLEGFEPPAAAANIPSSFTSDFSADSRFQNITVQPYVRAVYPFAGEYANELSFQADELIQLTKRLDSDWLEGRIGSRQGIFPQSFVQIVVPLEGESMVSDSQPSPCGQEGSAADGIGYATVRHDFIGRQKDELSVKFGDSIRVLRMANNDWVECKDPATDAIGIIPLSFLELYLDEDDEETRVRSDSKLDQSIPAFGSQPFGGPSPVTDWKPSFDTTPTAPASGSFQPNTVNAGWATFGEDWLVPDKKSSPPARPPPPKAAYASSGEEELTLAEMFSNADKAIARANGVKETSVATMENNPWLRSSVNGTNQERRSKVLEELINTELQFITDMNSFTEAVEASSSMNQKQKAVLKSGCAQIVQLAANLVSALTTEQGKDFEQQAVGACFLGLRKAFAQTYGYYFRNIEQINDLLQKAKSDIRLDGALKGVVKKMQDNGATVIDYTTAVSRPVQRCVKYPLFLNELAKYTPIQHCDHPKLTEAVKQMSTLGQKMNESKRKKELVKKYSEDQPSSTLGDMLSKFTVHSIKKKSNRFTYRMGSSLGVVKVARDFEFDCLVNELDACERRLVRFNYTLVIYKKKIFYETRQLIQKRLIDIRKRQVVLQGVDIEREIQPFHDEVKIFAELLNGQVRDEIVKALRAIPKKLIKKRNDKLMDWESVKSKEKSVGPQNHKFLDFEALNAQVKQTVPKVIEVLHKVLREVMETVKMMDTNLMTELRRLYSTASSSDASLDSYLSPHRLIVPNIPCFVDFYDENRLAALQAIVNKAERKTRNASFIAAGVEKGLKPRRGSGSSAPGTVELPATINYQPTASTVHIPTAKLEFGKKFRAQTVAERQVILQKAEIKDRRKEMYRVVTDWPATKEGLEENKDSGRMLICNKGDAVLLVSKQKDGMCVCYNGYYNAFLPFAIMQPWFSGAEAFKPLAATLTRPHSTPPKSQQISVNLIDLDDSPTESVPALQPHLHPTLTPTPSIFGTVSLVPTHSPASGPALEPVKPQSLLDEVKPIDWGAPIQPVPWTNQLSPFDTALTQKTPSLPNLTRDAFNPSPAFPVTFDDSPKEPSAQQTLTFNHLPPPGPSSSSSVAVTPTPSTQDAFMTMWEQIKSQPLSKVTQRSESPQPLIPTRPEASLIPASSTHSQSFSNAQPVFDFAQFGDYDTVPSEPFGGSAPTYSNISAVQPVPVFSNFTYDSPPSEMYSQPPMSMSYDAPPVEPVVPDRYKDKASIGTVQAIYDFSSQDAHQTSMKAGEKLELLQAHDDFGSPEWILVRPALGRSGYVPANYCSRC